MLNMLVIENNIYFAKLLINKIIQTNNNIRLCTIATDGEEALNILTKRRVDFIILDLNIPKFSGTQILKYLETTRKEEYNKSVIVISEKKQLIEEIVNNSVVFTFITKTEILDEVVKKVNEISIEKEILLKKIQKLKRKRIKIVQKIDKELYNLGYNIKYIGTNYLSDDIYLLYFLKNKKNIKLERDIYPIIAKNNNTTINTVKCDIIKATNLIRNNTYSQEIKEHFGWIFDEKIKPKAVMNVILKKLQQEM